MRVLSLLVALFALTPAVQAQELFVFANDGQSQDQQDLDTIQCQRMATDRTGFDPMATPTASRPPPQQQGGAVGGAARGALLGGAIGAVTGDTRRGLAAGAAGGGVLGGMRRADSNQQQANWEREQAANYQRQRNNWNRAFAACMESRGYTVG